MDMIEQATTRPTVRRYAMAPTMLMGSGNYFNFLSPETSSVTDEDVAYGLAFTARFRGQTVSQVTGRRCMYGVGEHILRGLAIIAPEFRYDWTMHELGEVPWGDFITPQKAFNPRLDDDEKRSFRAIGRQFGVSLVQPEEVKRVDLIMLATERRDLMPPTPGDPWGIIEGIEPLSERIVPMDIYNVAERLLAEIRVMRPA